MVTNDIDRQAVDAASSESAELYYLYFKYGTRLVVSTKMLSELESCKPPASDTLEAFLVNIVAVANFVIGEKQSFLVAPEKIGKIVNSCFEQSLCVQWGKIIKLRDDFVSSDTCQNF